MPEQVAQTGSNGFISYRRDDNSDFRGVADQLKADLTSLYEASTGRTLNLFVDRESIGWGADWRQQIQESVRQATVFIPLITMRYFNSQNCLDELLLFHASASRLGVTELLLPIVLFGSEQIREDDPRSEVRLIASLNYKNIERAWSAGYESALWREAMLDCVRALDVSLRVSEDLLVAEEQAASRPQSSPGPTLEVTESSSDVLAMTVAMEEIPLLSQEALGALTTLGEAAGGAFNGIDSGGLSAAQMSARLVKAAHDLREPAQEVERTSRELERRLLELDTNIRALISDLGGLELPLAQDQLAGLLTAFEESADLAGAQDEIARLEQMLTLVSLMNVSVRKALAPAVRGLRTLQTCVGIFRGWQRLRA